MSVVFSDAFGSALDTVTNWKDEAAVWSTSGGVLLSSTSNFRALQTTTSAHAALADCRVTARRASGTFDGCIYARGNITGATSDAGSCYMLNIFGTDQWELTRITRPSTTVNLVTAGDVGYVVTHVNGDLFGLEVTGTGATVTLKLLLNGAQVGPDVSDSGAGRITAAGQCGFRTFSTASRFDDFSVDDLVSPIAYLLPMTWTPTKTITRL